MTTDAKWAKRIAKMDAAEAKREKRRRAREAPMTDVGLKDVEATKPAAEADAGFWEGPRFATTILYGASSVWGGPGSGWLWTVDAADGGAVVLTDERGQPLTGIDPPAGFAGLGPRPACRYCGHKAKMEAEAYCLGCSRHGMDHKITPGRPKKPSATKYDGSPGKGVIETPDPKGRRRAG